MSVISTFKEILIDILYTAQSSKPCKSIQLTLGIILLKAIVFAISSWL